MIKYIYISLLPFLILYFNYLFKKKDILLNQSGDVHQAFTTKENVPLTGGLFILISFLFIFKEIDTFFLFFIVLIFFTGLFSDLKIIKTPIYKLLLQIIVIFLFVCFDNLEIANTRIYILDKILNYEYVNYFFTTFCILILINGTNFIDGLNTLVLGFYLIVFSLILYLNINGLLNLDFLQFDYLIIVLAVLCIFNFLNKLFLGDSGSYLLGFFLGVLLIKIYISNQYLSPFFIIQLMWYPAFENLFSILRKSQINKSPILPDKNHLHQLLFLYLKNKFSLKIKNSNFLAALLINFYNFLILLVASLNPSNSQYQIIILIFSMIFYSLIYVRLLRYKLKIYI